MGDIYPEDELGESYKGKIKKGSKTPLLDIFGVNLNKLASEGKLDPVVGREDEILRMIQILGRRRKNNPVLVGEPGVGKTAIVEGLVERLIRGDVPTSLQGKTVFTLELTSVVAGTKYRGQFEERMKGIIDELIDNPNVIVFIDEIHTIIGTGSASGGLDASNIIKPALARGQIRCIGATTFDEFRESIEEDGALERRFQKVVVDPSSVEETVEILNNIKHKYESHHGVIYSEKVIEEIVNLTDKYMIDRFLPDKAVDIVDEVGSYKHLSNSTIPKRIKNLEKRLTKKEIDKKKAVSDQMYELAARERDECVFLKNKIQFELEKWKTQSKETKFEITKDDVLYIISKAIGVPIEKISDDENKTLLGLADYLKSTVIGQDHAIDKIATTVQRNRVGIRRGDRTVGNFIFLGPTGVGKTQLAKEISNYLFDTQGSLIRIDMSEYMEKHTVSKLIGSPPGYVGHEDGGHLTEQVKRKPHSVILFDEIEKAHPDIFNVLLQLLDDGFLTDSLGRKIDFRNCLVILTSNAGVRDVQDFGTGIGFNKGKTIAESEQNEKDILDKALKKKFAPEFLNRIDEIIIFNKLTKDVVMSILENECKDLSDNLKEIGEYQFKISKGAKELVLEQGYDEKYGARPLRRALERMIENPISEMILKGELKPGDIINVKAVKDKLKIESETPNK
jgi:ATP-dependent Clp protease ATP-binding subunit ClpC